MAETRESSLFLLLYGMAYYSPCVPAKSLLLIFLALFLPSSLSSSPIWSNETQAAIYMRRCIELAELAVANGAQPYGALIVDPKNQTILAEGVNSATMNPIWHGEMAAIQNFSSKGINVYAVAPSLELYTSAEPCPMCMSAISWSGFGRVIYGSTIPFIEAQGAAQIDIRATEVVDSSSSLNHNITIVGPFLRNETDPLYVRCGALCRDGHDHGHHNHDHDYDKQAHDHDHEHTLKDEISRQGKTDQHT